MIALATSLHDQELPPPPSLDDWSPLAEASRLLGLHRDSLSRKCRDELARQHFAVLARAHDGGKPTWYVKRSYHKRLAPGAVDPSPVVAELQRFSRKQQQAAFARVAAVTEFRRWREQQVRPQRDWIGACLAAIRRQHPDLKVSQGTLYRWHNVYATPADVVKLIDARGGDTRSQGDPAAWAAFTKLYLQQSQPSAKTCWRKVKVLAQQEGFTWCTLTSCRYQLDTRIPKEVQVRHRQPKRWRQTLAPTGEMEVDAWSAGARWDADHKQLDMMVRVERDGRLMLARPWLTAFQDWRTRRIVGWCLSLGPNADTILAAFRMAMLDAANFGGPDEVHFDNGKDFDAYLFDGKSKSERLAKSAHKVDADEPTFKGIFGLLGIEIHFAIPHNPNGKPRVERWFRNTERFCQDWPGYVGRSVDTKPEELRRVEISPMLAPTFDQARDELAAWISAWNASADHSMHDLAEAGVKLSPDEALQRWRGADHVKVYDRDALDLCLQHWAKPVTVGRNGVRFAPYGGKSWGYGRFAPELIRYKKSGKKLFVTFDPDDLSRIRVFDEQLRFVAELERNEKGTKGNRDQVKRLHRAKRERDKALQVVRDTNHYAYMTDAQIMTMENAGRGASLGALVGAPHVKLVQTMLDRSLRSDRKRPNYKIKPPSLELMQAAHERHQRKLDEDIDLLADDGTFDRVMASRQAADDDLDVLDVIGGVA